MTRILNQVLACILSVIGGMAMGGTWYQVCVFTDSMMYVLGIK